MGFGGRFKQTEAVRVVADVNLRLEFPSDYEHPLRPMLRLPADLIPGVVGVRSCTQVRPSVVGFVAVDVIDLLGLSARHELKNHTAGAGSDTPALIPDFAAAVPFGIAALKG